MKNTLIGFVLALLLSACGAPLSETELSPMGTRDVPLVTDSEPLAQGLGAAGFEVVLSETENLLEVHEEVQGGLVSLTPMPEDYPRIELEELELDIPWCDPRFCDPAELIVGWQFEGAYITPKFAETLAQHDMDAYELVGLDVSQVAERLERFGAEIIFCGWWGCIPDPPICNWWGCPRPICPICEGLGRYIDFEARLTENLYDADLVIVDSPALANVEAELVGLIQLRGEGVAPVIQGTNVSVHPEVGEEMGAVLVETLLSGEVQRSLFEHAGTLPVTLELLAEIATGSFGEHVEGALNTHGGVGPGPVPTD